MSRPVARPINSSVESQTLAGSGSQGGPQGARRTALRAQLRQPMDDTTRRIIVAVASNGLDEIVQARLLAMGPPREAKAAPGRRKRQP